MFKNLKNEATGLLNKYKSQNPATYAAAQEAIGGLLILDGFTGIDNPFGGKKRPGIFGSLAGVIIGGVLLFAPNLIGNLTGINKMTATTQATIVSVKQQQSTSTDSNGNKETSTTCQPTAKYTVAGKEYTQGASLSSTSMCSLSAGDTTQISYNPDKPGQWATNLDGIRKLIKYFPWLGVIVMITGLFTFAIRLLSIIFGWKLLKRGRALAKTLPGGADLSGTVKQIEQEFKSHVFGGGATTPPAAPSPATPPTNPTPPPQAY